MPKVERWGEKYEDTRDWKQYNRHLINRGVFYINLIFLETWIQELKTMNDGKVGQPYKYPQSMIEFLAILYSKGFDYRALQGIMEGLSRKFGPFPVISFSQIRRRILSLPISYHKRAEKMICGADGSGIKVSNRGEWIRQAWKIRRGWIKVVILGNIDGDIIDVEVGDEKFDEKRSARRMMRKNKNSIDKILMDGLHDCKDTFNLCEELGIEPAIKIRANASHKGLSRRPREVRLYQEFGYTDWARSKGYGHRWVATEGIFSAEKRIFGEFVRSHKKKYMYKETKLKFWAYQKLRSVS